MVNGIACVNCGCASYEEYEAQDDILDCALCGNRYPRTFALQSEGHDVFRKAQRWDLIANLVTELDDRGPGRMADDDIESIVHVTLRNAVRRQ